ncbi:hypothetical protein JW948_17345 [bacterium]|nr:hypothetical protein [bacterium]
MLGWCAIAFLVGGLCGMMGMAVLAYGSKTNLMRENGVLRRRLNFLEHEDPRRRFTKVKDPRPEVHNLVS